MVSKPGDRLLHTAHDASLRTLDKVNDMVNLGTGGYLVLYLLYGIFQTLIACIYNAIGIGDVTQRALVDTFLLKDNSGNAMIADWIASKDDIGGHILLDNASALHKAIASHTHKVLENDATGKYDVMLKLAFASHLCTDAQHVVVADMDVMAYMDTVHEEVTVADDSSSIFIKATSNNDIFADAVTLANDDTRAMTYGVAETLGHSTDDSILVDVVVGTDFYTFEDAGVRHDDAVVADDSSTLNVSKWIYLHILPYLRLRMHIGQGAYQI